MKRKLFLLLCALLTSVGMQQVKADTSLLDEEIGWEKITALPGTLSNYYFTIVDNSSDLMLTLSRGQNQGNAYNGLYYKTSGNPLNDKSMLFTLEANGDYHVMTNVEFNGYFLQTEWNAAHLYRTHDNGGGDKSWGNVDFTYQDGGFWTIQNGKYSVDDGNYLGVWNDGEAAANGQELALNKANTNRGTYQIYAILKADAQDYWDEVAAGTGASVETPVDMTSLIVNPNARFWTGSIPYGWTTTGTQNVNNGAGYDQFPGIFEYSNWGASSWTGSLEQTITVPNGKYVVKAALMAETGVTAYLYANDDHSDNFVPIGNSGGNILPDGTETEMGSGERGYKYLTVQTTVTNGSLTLGTYASASSAHQWVNADNFTLSYLGESLDDYETPLANAKTAASAVDQDSPMNASVLSALQSAITSYGSKAFESYTTVSEITTAISALNTAATNANASISVYEDIADLIDSYQALADELDASGQAAYDDSAIDTKYDNGTYETVSAAEEDLLEAYRSAVKSQTTNGTDMTAVISNNSFETGNTTSWTTIESSDTGARDYTMTGKDGTYVFNTWSKGTPITQNIGTLKAGYYKLSAVVASSGATVYLLANGTHPTSGAKTIDGYGNDGITAEYLFQLTEETDDVIIGAVGGNTDGSYIEEGYWWYKADNFRLTYYNALPDAPTAVSSKINATVKTTQDNAISAYNSSKTVANYNAAASAVSSAQASAIAYAVMTTGYETYSAKSTANLTSAGQTAFSNSAAVSNYQDGNYEDTQANTAISDMQTAYVSALKAYPAVGADMTDAITNPSFETGNLTGWTNSDPGMWTQGNKSFDRTDGSYYAECWHPASAGTFSVENTVTGLPSGFYQLTVAAYADATSAKIYAIIGEDETNTAVTSSADYSVNIYHDGTSTFIIGYSAEMAQNTGWVCVDNFRLTYYGMTDATFLIKDADCSDNTNWPGSGRTVNNMAAYDGETRNVFSSNSDLSTASKNGQRHQTITLPVAGTYKLTTYCKVPGTNSNGYAQIWVDDLGNYIDYTNARHLYTVDTDGDNTSTINTDGSGWYANDIYFSATAGGSKTIYINLSAGDGNDNHNKFAYVSGMKLTYLGTTPEVTFDEAVINPVVEEDLASADVTIARKMKSDRWNTFTVPFNMDIPDGWTVKELTKLDFNESTSNYSLTFEAASNIVAGKAYMVKPGSDVDVVNANGVTINTSTVTPSQVEDGNYTANFVGNNNYMASAPSGSYIISNNVFYCVNSIVIQKGFRGYITVSENYGARATVSFGMDDDVTGIQNVVVEGLDESGAQKDGKYLIDGKIVIVKNGVKYGANGQILK